MRETDAMSRCRGALYFRDVADVMPPLRELYRTTPSCLLKFNYHYRRRPERGQLRLISAFHFHFLITPPSILCRKTAYYADASHLSIFGVASANYKPTSAAAF